MDREIRKRGVAGPRSEGRVAASGGCSSVRCRQRNAGAHWWLSTWRPCLLVSLLYCSRFLSPPRMSRGRKLHSLRSTSPEMLSPL